MAVFVLSLAAFAVVLAVAEVAHRRFGVSSEDTRRLAHVGSSLVATALPFVLGWPAIVALGVGFSTLMALSKWRGTLTGVHRVTRRTWGEVFFPAGLTLLAAFQPPRELFVFGALVMGISDGAAGFVGQHLGRHPYTVGVAAKTIEGSAAFLVSTLVLGSVVLGLGGADTWTVAGALVVATVLTVLEGVLPWGLDNLVLPGAAAVLLYGLSRYGLSCCP